MAIAGILHNLTGDYSEAVAAFTRVWAESRGMHRRTPELPLMVANWLARSYMGSGQNEQAARMLAAATDVAQQQRERGFGQYPPFLWELAVLQNLSGQRDAAFLTWQDAIDRGWRHHYIYGAFFNPPQADYSDDERFKQTIQQLETEVSAMRQSVRDNGWAETPEEFFGRDRLIVTGAK